MRGFVAGVFKPVPDISSPVLMAPQGISSEPVRVYSCPNLDWRQAYQ